MHISVHILGSNAYHRKATLGNNLLLGSKLQFEISYPVWGDAACRLDCRELSRSPLRLPRQLVRFIVKPASLGLLLRVANEWRRICR